MKDIKVIAIDADDTLWDNQSYYDRAGDFFADTLKEYGTADRLQDRLFETEIANMPLLGYGAKSVCISMMESAMAERFARMGAAGDNSAVTSGEAQRLIDALFACENAEYTSSGHRTMALLSVEDLDRKF